MIKTFEEVFEEIKKIDKNAVYTEEKDYYKNISFSDYSIQFMESNHGMARVFYKNKPIHLFGYGEYDILIRCIEFQKSIKELKDDK